MANKPLHQQALKLRQSLFDEGGLDNQFIELEKLEDPENPNFVQEIFTDYFLETAKLFHNIDQELSGTPIDYSQLWKMLNHYKGNCASLGAGQLKEKCDTVKEYCDTEDADGCKEAFEEIKDIYGTFRKKMEYYFQIVKEAAAAERG